jgi:D-3-phosphoglycerate dehydrogenase
MKLVFLEPIGIPQTKLETMVNETIGSKIEVVYYHTRVEDPQTLIERSKDADVVVLSNIQFRKEIIEQCHNLKMICVAFTGVDHIDTAYCKERDIMICNCAGYSTVAVSDLVFGFVIDLARKIIPCDKVTREGGTKDGLVGFELEGKKFGIIGAGAIGMRTAAIAKAFGCEVFAYSRTVKVVEGINFVDLDTLLSTCDIISLHVPLTDYTRGLINAYTLALMKPSAILINTARGPVVNYKDLADALKKGIIAGAAVDVFEIEPPIPADHVLFGVPNLIVTPHIAFASQQAFEKRAGIVINNIDKWLLDTPQNIII